MTRISRCFRIKQLIEHHAQHHQWLMYVLTLRCGLTITCDILLECAHVITTWCARVIRYVVQSYTLVKLIMQVLYCTHVLSCGWCAPLHQCFTLQYNR